MAGTLTIAGHSATEPAGERNLGPLTIQGKAAGATLVRPLKSGDNTFEVPAEAAVALLIPPTGNSAELKVRTSHNEADAGLPISEGNPTLFSLPVSVPATVIVHASAAVAADFTVVFV